MTAEHRKYPLEFEVKLAQLCVHKQRSVTWVEA